MGQPRSDQVRWGDANFYGYISGNPIHGKDLLGLCGDDKCKKLKGPLDTVNGRKPINSEKAGKNSEKKPIIKPGDYTGDDAKEAKKQAPNGIPFVNGYPDFTTCE